MFRFFRDVLIVLITAIKSKLGPDVLSIPDNVGNNLLISNSTIITHGRLSTILRVTLLGREVPHNFMSVIQSEFDRYGLQVTMFVKFKLQSMSYDSKARKVIDVNIDGWDRQIQTQEGKLKEDAIWGIKSARTLLSTTSFNSAMYIMLYATDGRTLRRAVDIVKQMLSKSGSLGYNGTYTLRQLLDEYSVSSLQPPGGQRFPMTGDEVAKVAPLPLIPSNKGTVFGMNIITKEPYTIDFTKETEARNILIIAPSGSGKTYMLYNIAQNVMEHGSRMVAIDIKGNEYITLCKSVGGTILDLSDYSTYYLDSVRRIYSSGDPKKYFNDMDLLLHKTLCILSGEYINDSIERTFLNFISAMWVELGVVSDNIETWEATHVLDLPSVYEMLQSYCYRQATADKDLYKAVDNIGKFISRSSAYGFAFTNPINISEILDRRAVVFSFGILTGQTSEPTLFKLRWNYMDFISTTYIYNNYKSSIRTFVIMEEAQVVSDDLMEVYKKHYTLGRSLLQDNVFVANSFKTVKSRESAKPILENAKIIVTASLPPKVKEEFITEYGLEDFRYMLDKLDKPNNKYSFFCYMMSRSTPPGVFISLSDRKNLTVSKPV